MALSKAEVATRTAELARQRIYEKETSMDAALVFGTREFYKPLTVNPEDWHNLLERYRTSGWKIKYNTVTKFYRFS